MNVFGNTLTPTTAAQQSQQQNTVRAFNGTMKTSDGKYSVTLNVNPNQFGTNVFTVTVTDLSTGKQLGANQASVTIFTTMLDMDMGTQSASLQSNGKGGFSASGELSMGGNWQIQVLLRTPDGKLHEANFKIYTPI
jgi:copper transport protein